MKNNDLTEDELRLAEKIKIKSDEIFDKQYDLFFLFESIRMFDEFLQDELSVFKKLNSIDDFKLRIEYIYEEFQYLYEVYKKAENTINFLNMKSLTFEIENNSKYNKFKKIISEFTGFNKDLIRISAKQLISNSDEIKFKVLNNNYVLYYKSELDKVNKEYTLAINND